MGIESGDILYATLVVGVAMVGYRVARSPELSVLTKIVMTGIGLALLLDFHGNYGRKFDTAQEWLWLTVTPDRALISGILAGLVFALRDRYAPMLSEAGLMVQRMKAQAEEELARQRGIIEADLAQQQRELNAEVTERHRECDEELAQRRRDTEAEITRRRYEADEQLAKEEAEARERLEEELRETRRQAEEDREHARREREAAVRGGTHPKRPDPYEVLGLSRDATPAEIKKRYRQLIAQYHPDKATQTTPEIRMLAEERVKEINWAYERLRD